MNKELKQKWVDALRSGEYIQGTEFLKSGDEFCCLGVLADLLGEQWAPRGDEISYHGINYQSGDDEYLISSILGWNFQEMVASMNDAGIHLKTLQIILKKN